MKLHQIKIKNIDLIFIFLIFMILITACTQKPIENSSVNQRNLNTIQTHKDLVKVVKVIDGDTIELENGQKVRYIGVNTPETVDPRKSIECYGKEASNKNKELVEGKFVRLEKDVSETDRYGRLLRYIWINDTFVNEYLVREGYAQVSTYPPDVKYEERFLDAQRIAVNEERGLWGSKCENTQLNINVSISTTNQTQTNTSSISKLQSQINETSYVCSYNAYNCNDFSTHNEAQTAFIKCGGVNKDIHRLDADHDGIACESLP